MSKITDNFINLFESLKSVKSTLWRLLKCVIVAVIGYWVDFGLYALIITQCFDITIEESDRGQLDPNISMAIFMVQAITYIVGILVNYFLNKYWSFGIRKDYSKKYFIRFIIVTAIAFGAKQFCVYILTDYYAVDELLSVLAASLFTFIINYSGNTLWVFNKHADELAAQRKKTKK